MAHLGLKHLHRGKPSHARVFAHVLQTLICAGSFADGWVCTRSTKGRAQAENVGIRVSQAVAPWRTACRRRCSIAAVFSASHRVGPALGYADRIGRQCDGKPGGCDCILKAKGATPACIRRVYPVANHTRTQISLIGRGSTRPTVQCKEPQDAGARRVLDRRRRRCRVGLRSGGQCGAEKV